MIVHLVDGTYELFRYFLAAAAAFDRSAPPELRAVRGVVASVLEMLEGGATHLGVATHHGAPRDLSEGSERELPRSGRPPHRH